MCFIKNSNDCRVALQSTISKLSPMTTIGNACKPTIGNESLHDTTGDRGMRLINFALSKDVAPHFLIIIYAKGYFFSLIRLTADSRHISNNTDVKNPRENNDNSDHYLVRTMGIVLHLKNKFLKLVL